MDEYTILVAFDVEAPSPEQAQALLLPRLRAALSSEGGPADGFWVAEDNRIDGSDRDSAVLCKPGAQAAASRALSQQGLGAPHNIVRQDRPIAFPRVGA